MVRPLTPFALVMSMLLLASCSSDSSEPTTPLAPEVPEAAAFSRAPAMDEVTFDKGPLGTSETNPVDPSSEVRAVDLRLVATSGESYDLFRHSGAGINYFVETSQGIEGTAVWIPEAKTLVLAIAGATSGSHLLFQYQLKLYAGGRLQGHYRYSGLFVGSGNATMSVTVGAFPSS